MGKTEQLREELRKRDDLLPKLIELWKANASVDDTLKVIKDAGLDVTYEEVENLLSFVQKEHASDISFEKIDMDELAKVSGGGTGNDCKQAEDCDKHFLEYTIMATDERCITQLQCDELRLWVTNKDCKLPSYALY